MLAMRWHQFCWQMYVNYAHTENAAHKTRLQYGVLLMNMWRGYRAFGVAAVNGHRVLVHAALLQYSLDGASVVGAFAMTC